MDDSPLITAADLAAKLNVSRELVYRMCRTGKWPHAKIGALYRFNEEPDVSIYRVVDGIPKKWTGTDFAYQVA